MEIRGIYHFDRFDGALSREESARKSGVAQAPR